ncbi:hypothetical protein KKF55_04285, partial [Patescibacteria group bacterium]|nr:hypothetical protein [Patescibacteria group bacterium]
GFAVNLSNPSGGVAEGYPLVTLSAVLPDGTVFSDTSGGGRYDNMDMRVSTGKDGQYVTVDKPKTLEDRQALAHAALDAYVYAGERGDTTLDYEGYYYAAQARVDAAIAAMYPDNQTLTQQEEETIDDLVKVVVEMEVAGLGLNTQADIAKLMAKDAVLGTAYTYDLGEIQGEKTTPEAIVFTPRMNGKISFKLNEPSMVNLSVDAGDVRLGSEVMLNDITLYLTGEGIAYTSDKPVSGESISSVLPKGEYTLTIIDNTDYESQTLLSNDEISQMMLNVKVGMNIKPYRTQKIEGRISIPESSETMPVSMSVAEFVQKEDGTWERKEANNTQSLDPNKPVWVVIHGRGDSEYGNNINYLAQVLSQKNFQVVTLDWNKAASDNGIGILDGANWISAVGAWSSNQLKAVGFPGEKIIIPSHSWGSFVAYEIAEQYKKDNGFGVQGIVALDSPLDPLPVNSYPATEVVFNDVSKVSWALHSSIFGSSARSNTADFNFELPGLHDDIEEQLLTSEQKMLLDAAQAFFSEHGYAVSYFANLVNGLGDSSLDLLDVQKLLQGQMLNMPVDSDAPEGILPYTIKKNTGPQGEYWQAVPTYYLEYSE